MPSTLSSLYFRREARKRGPVTITVVYPDQLMDRLQDQFQNLGSLLVHLAKRLGTKTDKIMVANRDGKLGVYKWETIKKHPEIVAGVPMGLYNEICGKLQIMYGWIADKFEGAIDGNGLVNSLPMTGVTLPDVQIAKSLFAWQMHLYMWARPNSDGVVLFGGATEQWVFHVVQNMPPDRWSDYSQMGYQLLMQAGKFSLLYIDRSTHASNRKRPA